MTGRIQAEHRQDESASARVATSEHSGAPGSTPLSAAMIGDLLRLFDVAAVFLSGLGIYLAYVYPVEPHTLGRYLIALLVAGVVFGVMSHRVGVYSQGFLFNESAHMGRMVACWAISFALLLATAFALKISDTYSRIWASAWLVSVPIALGVGRLATRRWTARLARAGRFASRSVIVGTGPQAEMLAIHLAEHDTLNTAVLGFVEAGSGGNASPNLEHGILGGIDELLAMIRRGEVDQVFLAVPWTQVDSVRDVVRRLAVTPAPVRLAPDLAAFDFPNRNFIDVAGLPVLPLFDRPISGWSQTAKALEDRVLGTLFLVLLSPLLVLIAVAIKLDSPGPVLFKQPRYGFNDQLIEVWKFRTMHSHLTDPGADRLTSPADERVTRIGRILRRTSLDELPQLLNVLRGEMSIVGPRPHAVAAKAAGRLYFEAVEQYAARHKVKPGITGWAQINGWRGETDTVEKLRKRLEHDLYYIDNWSVWFDLYIIARSVFVIFKDQNAY